jgi:hypothetical protein
MASLFRINSSRLKAFDFVKKVSGTNSSIVVNREFFELGKIRFTNAKLNCFNSTWQQEIFKNWTGTAWQTRPVRFWNGDIWIQIY